MTARRIPNPEGQSAEVEVRPLFEADDFGPQLTRELRAKEQELRAKSAFAMNRA